MPTIPTISRVKVMRAMCLSVLGPETSAGSTSDTPSSSAVRPPPAFSIRRLSSTAASRKSICTGPGEGAYGLIDSATDMGGLPASEGVAGAILPRPGCGLPSAIAQAPVLSARKDSLFLRPQLADNQRGGADVKVTAGALAARRLR